jgi:hypothetical protein
MLAVKLGITAEHTVYEAEIVGILLALQLVKQRAGVSQ